LYLNGNQMTTAGYTASESWASSMSVIPGRGTIDFNDNVDGVISTNLESILVSKGWTVEGDPNLLPFDVTANWSLTTPAVTDEASFRTFLETGRDPSNNYNYLTNLVITGFSITTVSGVQKRIQCNLYATSTSSTYNLRALQITQINALGNIPIKTSLNLISNQIPSIVTLSSTSIFNNLQVLTVDSNQLGSTFNSINWPPNLTQLSAKNNNTLSFNPTNPLPNSMSSLSITGNGITGANMNYTKLPTGLTFLNITTNPLGGNFNPSVPLPNGIHTLYLEQCQLTSLNPTFSLPSSLISFYASNNFITSIDVSKLPNTLQNLFLSSNSLTSAINNHVWPSSLRYLNLNFNPTIGTFNPVNPLPSLLNELGLQQTGISSFNPTLALPSTLKILNVSQNPITSFNPTLALPSGLLTLYLSQTQIVSFNPTNPLPSSITTLWFNSSQMTTAGYTASEPWANAMSVIPGRGNVQFTGNINSVSGTNLQTILISKGWTVTV
jgi:Leucine-rich repeat (LRR) protein